jgi:Na+-translocating ferredoxin:NAD+ oxidoreductase RNF subunit RnfB
MDVPVMLMAAGLIALLGAATAGLAVSSTRHRHTHIADPRLQAVLKALPGADCGACGNRSCLATAVGVVEGALPCDACKTGGPDVACAVEMAAGIPHADAHADVTTVTRRTG